MIRQGKLCTTCNGGCREKPTPTQPMDIECPICAGTNCSECDDGWVSITECPKTYCQEIVPALDLIDLFWKGLPPNAGGTMDQTQWFLTAAKTLKHDETLIKNDG